jgi:hypothetical protein
MASELGSPIFDSNAQSRDFSLPRPAWCLLLARPHLLLLLPPPPLCLVHLLPSPLAMEVLIKGLVKVVIDSAEEGCIWLTHDNLNYFQFFYENCKFDDKLSYLF